MRRNEFPEDESRLPQPSKRLPHGRRVGVDVLGDRLVVGEVPRLLAQQELQQAEIEMRQLQSGDAPASTQQYGHPGVACARRPRTVEDHYCFDTSDRGITHGSLSPEKPRRPSPARERSARARRRARAQTRRPKAPATQADRRELRCPPRRARAPARERSALRPQPPRATLVPLSRRCHGFRRRRSERR